MYGAIRITAFNKPYAFKQAFRVDSFYNDEPFEFDLDRFPGSEGIVMGKKKFISFMNYLNEVSKNIEKEDGRKE